MRQRHFSPAAAFAAWTLSIVLSGCGDPASSDPASGQLGTASPAADSSNPDNATEAEPAVGLRVGDSAVLAEVLEEHRGKVVLVDFWATWCLACMEQLPHTVDLHRRWGDRGLAVISVSLDDRDSESRVRRFLTDQGATFDNLLSTHGAGLKSFDDFGMEDGTLPHYRVYDREGRLHKSFGAGAGPFDVKDIDRALESLLADASPP